MKRKLALATVVAAALIGTGTASAVAFASEDTPQTPEQRVAVQLGDGSDDSDDNADDGDDRDDRQGSDDDRDDHGEQDDDAREARAAKTAAPEAAAAALQAVPGTVTELGLDTRKGGLVWETDVLGKDGKSYDLTVDAGNGKVLNKHTDRDDDADGRNAAKDLKGKASTAAEAARAAGTNGSVTSVDLEDDGSRAVWEVETVGENGTEREVAVDAATGKVTQLQSDDD